MRTKYKRILLKLSGESLMGAQGYGIDPVRVSDYAEQIKEIAEGGVRLNGCLITCDEAQKKAVAVARFSLAQ